MALAKQYNIKTGTNWCLFFTNEVGIVVEATGNLAVFEEVKKMRHEKMVVILRSVIHSTAALMEEKEKLIRILKDSSYKYDLIFNSTHDGMIVIDQDGIVTLFNRSTERGTGYRKEDVLGKNIYECFPNSELPNTLKNKKVDRNQEFLLQNGRKIITSRIPMLNEEGNLFEAFSVFRDITEVVDLAEELTNLKEIQTMFEAIIQPSEEAISVVDEQGRGILINPNEKTGARGIRDGKRAVCPCHS
jgi:PAS domain S-box-containing protein